MTDIAAINKVVITGEDQTKGVFDSVIGGLKNIKTEALSTQAGFVALGSAIGVGSFAYAIASAIKMQAELDNLSQSTGFTVEALSAIKSASNVVGANFELVTKQLAQLDKAMFATATNSKGATTAFQGLGIAVTNAAGELRKPDDVMLEIAQRFSEMENGALKAALAQQIFGRSGAALIPVLEELAIVGAYQAKVSQQQAFYADDLEKNLHRLSESNKGIWNTIAGEATEALDAFARGILNVINQGGGLRDWINKLAADGTLQFYFRRIVVVLAETVDAFIDVINVGGRLIDTAKAIGGAFAPLWEIIAGGFTTITGVIAGAIKFMAGDFEGGMATMAATSDEGIARVRAGWTSLKNVGKDVGKIWEDFAPSTKVKDAVVQQLILLDTMDTSVKKMKPALDDFKKSTEEAFDPKPILDYLDALQRQGVKLDAELQSLTLYGQKTAETSLAVAQFDVTEGRLAATLAQLAKINPELAEGIKKSILAQAAQNDQMKTSIALTEAYVASVKKWIDSLSQAVQSSVDQVKAEEDRNAQFGLTQAQIVGLTIAELQHTNAVLAGVEGTELDIKANELRIANLQKVQGLLADRDAMQQQLGMWQELDRIGQDAFQHIGEKGHNILADLGADLKKYLLDMLYQLTLKKWIISIATSVSGPGVGNALANQGGGGGNPLSLLSGLFGGGAAAGGSLGFAGGELATLFGASSFGASGAGVGFGVGASALAGSGMAGLGTLAAAAIPVIGWIAAAGALIYSIIQSNKKPAEVKGQLAISQGTTGFEDNAYTSSKFGNIGFSDAGTQQFSGEVGQTLNKLIAGAIAAFDSRFSKEQSDAFAEVLKNMTFEAFEGTFTTEDFLQKYGGQALQQVVVAAFDVLDPALASVAKQFSGTADEVGTFANTLLGIYDLTKELPEKLRANIESGLVDATQATADKVAAFAAILVSFGDQFPRLGHQFGELSGKDIPAFIDALGGAQAALQAFNYLDQNFLTSQQRVDKAISTLNQDFADLGITQIPQTHEEFLKLLGSFDLTTEAGREMYASVVKLAPLFVEVHGTADDAATAVKSLADAAKQLSGSALQSAQEYFNKHFLSPAEQDRLRVDDDLKKVADATDEWHKQLKKLGYDAIPTTVEGFRKLYDAVVAVYGADSVFAKGLLLLAPTIVDLGTSATDTANKISDAVDTIANIQYPDTASAAEKFVSNFLNKIKSLADGSSGDFGDKAGIEIPLVQKQIDSINAQIAQAWIDSGGVFNTTIETLQQEAGGLNDFNDTLTKQLAQFTTFKAQYGSAIAQQLLDLQTWYDGQAQALRNNSDALAALKTIFDQKWAAIIAGTSTGVTGTISELDRLRKSILDYANGLSVGSLTILSPQAQLAAAQQQYAAELAKAQTGDTGALGDITKFADTYLNLARQNFASGQQYTDIFTAVQNALRDLGTPPTIISDASVPGVPLASTSGPKPPTAADATTQIAAALPRAGRRLASSEDITTMATQIIAAMSDTAKAQADAGTQDAATIKRELTHTRLAVVDAINSGLK